MKPTRIINVFLKTALIAAMLAFPAGCKKLEEGEACQEAAACAQGLTCLDDACFALRKVDGACEKTAQCASGLKCHDKKCLTNAGIARAKQAVIDGKEQERAAEFPLLIAAAFSPDTLQEQVGQIRGMIRKIKRSWKFRSWKKGADYIRPLEVIAASLDKIGAEVKAGNHAQLALPILAGAVAAEECSFGGLAGAWGMLSAEGRRSNRELDIIEFRQNLGKACMSFFKPFELGVAILGASGTREVRLALARAIEGTYREGQEQWSRSLNRIKELYAEEYDPETKETIGPLVQAVVKKEQEKEANNEG